MIAFTISSGKLFSTKSYVLSLIRLSSLIGLQTLEYIRLRRRHFDDPPIKIVFIGPFITGGEGGVRELSSATGLPLWKINRPRYQVAIEVNTKIKR